MIKDKMQYTLEGGVEVARNAMEWNGEPYLGLVDEIVRSLLDLHFLWAARRPWFKRGLVGLLPASCLS